MTFNEDTRVKIPAILTLTRLGYDYISLKGRDDIDQETNIFKDIFFKNIRKLNPSVEETNIQKFFQKIQLMLDNDDLGKEFYQNLQNKPVLLWLILFFFITPINLMVLSLAYLQT